MDPFGWRSSYLDKAANLQYTVAVAVQAGKESIPMPDAIDAIFRCAGVNVPFVMECDMPASIEWFRAHKLIP